MKLSLLFSLLAPVASFMSTHGVTSGVSTHLNAESNRRGFLASSAAAAAIALSIPQPSFAVSEISSVDVYFGVGCYWHIMHEFVETERKLLSRADNEREVAARSAMADNTRVPPLKQDHTGG